MNIDLKAIRAAAEAANKSEWVINTHDTSFTIVSTSNRKAVKRDRICEVVWWSGGVYGPAKHEAEANAKHIATANPATILALLDRLEAAEKDAARMSWLVDNDVDAAELFATTSGTFIRNHIDATMGEQT